MTQGLLFTYRTVDHLPDVTIMHISGSIDSDTAPQFEHELIGLLENKKVKILVDLSDVDYISSAGVGIFVGMLSDFRDEPEGDIKACHVSNKIMKVFETIGLDDMLEFYDTIDDVKKWSGGEVIVDELDHFDLSILLDGPLYRGVPAQLTIHAKNAKNELIHDYHEQPEITLSSGMVVPTEVSGFQNGVWQGEITIHASGKTILSVSDSGKKGILDLFIDEKKGKAKFPMEINCQTCQNQIVVNSADIYRCENCDETFQIDEWGQIITIRSGSTAKRRKSKYKGMELKINTDVNYMVVIRTSLKGLCEKEGMSPETTNEVVLAVEEIILNLIEHGNDFDPWQVLILKVHFQKKQVKIQIRDYGDGFDITQQKTSTIKANIVKGKKRGVGAFMVNKIMDLVKYVSKPNYNELTMVKRYGPEDEN